jgi:HK97 family phage major capsid protein
MELDISVLGIRGKVAMAQRAGFTSSDLAAVNVQIQTGVIGLGVQRLTIMDLIAPGQTGAAAIIYPQENSFGTVDGAAPAAGSGGETGMPRAKSVGERGLKPLWEPDLTTVTANVRKVAITTKVPDEFMADFPAAQSFIDERLPFMVDTETEFQILYGDGLGNNLKGIFTFANVQTRAITNTDDSTKAASLLQGLTDIRVGSFFEPDGYAFHPYDWETAKLLKDTTGRFLAGGPYYIPYTNGVFMELNTFWGKPVVVSTAVTYRRPLAGCWKLGAQYFMREGMRLEMTNANEDDFRRNLIMLRAEHRLALAVYRPLAFMEFTGFPARA